MTDTVELLEGADRISVVWPLIRHMVDVCVREACDNELETDDILPLLLTGRAFMFVQWEAGEPTMVLGLELIPYPRLKAANVFVLGGRHGFTFTGKYWAVIKDWLKANGIQAVDCWVNDQMKHIMENRRYGFRKVYNHMRLRLGD